MVTSLDAEAKSHTPVFLASERVVQLMFTFTRRPGARRLSTRCSRAWLSGWFQAILGNTALGARNLPLLGFSQAAGVGVAWTT